jgi:hypothetical protein
MNKLFIYSMALMLSLALGYGVAIPQQSALAAIAEGYYGNSYSNSYDNSYSKYPQKSMSYDNSYSKYPQKSMSYDNSYSKYPQKSMSYDNSYSKYPQKSMSYDNNHKKQFKPYECRKGQLEGFLTSSVEFCIAKTR